MEVPERCDHLGHRVRVHVGRLDRNKWTERFGVLDDDLGNQPRIDQGVVGVYEDAPAPGLFAPPCDIHEISDISRGVGAAGLRTGRKDLDASVKDDVLHHALLC